MKKQKRNGFVRVFGYLSAFTILSSILISLILNSSVLAVDTYTLTVDGNGTASIRGPVVPSSPRTVSFSQDYNTNANPITGHYSFTDGDPSSGSGDYCTYIIATSNGKKTDTSGTLGVTGSASKCGNLNGKTYQITITVNSLTKTGTWLDHSTISVDGVDYTDPKIDDNLTFTAKGSGCVNGSTISGFSHQGNDPANATATVNLELLSGSSGNCTSQTYSLKLSDPNNLYNAYFVWQDSTTISTSDGTGVIFLNTDPTTNLYFGTAGRSGDGSSPKTCHASSIEAALGVTTGQLILRNGNLHEGWQDKISGATLNNIGGCEQSGKISVQIARGPNATKAGGSSDVAKGVGSGAQGDGSQKPSCESKGGDFAWGICPIVRMVDSALKWVDEQIEALLEVDQKPFNSGSGLQQAWAQIRNIAYIILVPMMLVMVIGTALGFSFVDAYTVRRALPRMVIAILFIALSWELTTFLITVSNVVGAGVMGILTLPFKGAASALGADSISHLTLSSLFAGSNNVGGFLETIAASAAFAVGAIVLLWLFGSALLLAATLAFIVLVLRQLFIVALVIFAPLAILAWIFPGNDKLWGAWWSMFSKLLLMFPLIMALLAIGRDFAVIIHQGGLGDNDAGSVIAKIAIVIAWLVPYALIPLTYRFAGGAYAFATGWVGDKGKGISERQRKKRAERVQQRAQKTLAGEAFNSNSRLGRTLNRPFQTAAMAATGRGGINPLNMKSKINSVRGVAAGSEMAELADKNEDIKAVSVDDHLAEATQVAQGRAQIRDMLRNSRNRDGSASRWATAQPQELEEAVSQVQRAQRAGSTTAVRSAMSVARAASGTGYGSSSDMYKSIIQAAGGNRQLEGSLLAATRSASERARRPDLASVGHVEQATYMDQVRATMGTADEADTDARVNASMRARSFETSGAHAAVSGRTEAVGNMLVEMGNDYNHAIETGDVQMATEVASQITSVRQAQSAATPDVRRQIMGMLDTVGFDADSAESVPQQLGARIGGMAYGGGGPEQQQRLVQAAIQQIGTRAGTYDQGTLGRTPEQIRAGVPEPPQPPTP